MSTPALDRGARALHAESPRWDTAWEDLTPAERRDFREDTARTVSAALHDPDNDVIARTLDEHRASPATSPYCRCGWRPGMSLNDTEADRRQHRAHQADAVRAAILGSRQAERCAWCDAPASVHSAHSDGRTYPSCGATGHGLGEAS